jgi:predicted peroxiredoxin
MKPTVIFSFLSLLALAVAPPLAPTASGADEPARTAPRDGVFLHVSSGPESAHRVLMALKMADVMSEKGDRDVLVYFDIEGIKVLLKDAPDIAHKGFDGSRAQLARIMGRGVKIFACPGCLKAADKTPEDLMPGVAVADRDAFFAFTEGRILTLDY